MNSHKCRHCNDDFVCGTEIVSCFKSQTTCDECFRVKVLDNIFKVSISALLVAALIQTFVSIFTQLGQ